MDSKGLVVIGGVVIALGFFSLIFFGTSPEAKVGTLDARWFHSACFIVGVSCFGGAWYLSRRHR